VKKMPVVEARIGEDPLAVAGGVEIKAAPALSVVQAAAAAGSTILVQNPRSGLFVRADGVVGRRIIAEAVLGLPPFDGDEPLRFAFRG
jgi:hypothetical protein